MFRLLLCVLVVVRLSTALVEITAGSKTEHYVSHSCENTTHSKSSRVTKVFALQCTNLYTEQDCRGRFIRYMPYNPTSMVGEVSHVWNANQELITSHLVVGSIGKCRHSCDPKNWDNLNLTETVSVTVYENSDYQGNRHTLPVNVSSCISIPSGLRRVLSVKIIGSEQSCIELHSTTGCSNGSYTILRPGYPMLNNLRFYGMQNTTGFTTEQQQMSAYNVKAISLCGKYCKTLATKSSTIATKPPPALVIHDDVYQGFRKNVDITITSNFVANFSTGTASLNVSGCTTPSTFLAELEVMEITSNNGKCINLYSETNCRGRVVRWKPYFQRMQFKRSTGFQPKSVAPCVGKCDPVYWADADLKKEVEISLFDVPPFSGKRTDLLVKPGECLPFPRSVEPAAAIIGGNNSCIELHYEPHCGSDKYVILRSGYPSLDHLRDYGLYDSHDVFIEQARAVSICGTFCKGKRQLKDVNDPPKKYPGRGIVTIYDDRGYYGIPTNFNLSGGCLKFEQRHGIWGSLWTYGQCVVVFADANCQQPDDNSFALQTSGKPAKYYMEKIASATYPQSMRSMRLCNEIEFHEGVGSFMYFYWIIGLWIIVNAALSAAFGAYVCSRLHKCYSEQDGKGSTVLYTPEN